MKKRSLFEILLGLYSEFKDNEGITQEVTTYKKNGKVITVTTFFSSLGDCLGTETSVKNEEAPIDTEAVIAELEKLKKQAIEDEDFTKAAIYRDKIKEIKK